MRSMQFPALLALVFATVTPALADDDANCGDTPRDQWMSEASIKAKAAELGYDVRRVKEEDGCYEVRGFDKNGAKVEIYMNPATGAVVKTGSDS
jgi:hypothetical protein